jgi:ABC-type glycerol-3-phosphate transport system substrate-binding protein
LNWYERIRIDADRRTHFQEVQSVNDETTKIVTPSWSRRKVLKTGAAVGAAGLAAGISPKASKVFAAPTILQGEPVTIDYLTWFYNEPGRGDAWTQMIADFEASQSEIKVNMTGWAFDEFTNNIIVQLQAGGIDGDLVQTTPDLVLRLLQAGVLTSLNPVLEANGIDTLSAAHDYITVDGEVMGLDVVTVVFGLFYNTALFEAAGVTAPVDPNQWMEVSEALTERPNQFGLFNDHLMSEAESFWFTLQQWACIYDGTWAEGATPLLTSQPVLDALTLFKRAYDNSFP